MLQELSYGKLENEFHNRKPQPEDLVICFQNHQILLKREESSVAFPSVAEVTPWMENRETWYGEGFRYVFKMQEKNYFLWLGDLEEAGFGEYTFEPMRMFRYKGVHSDLLYGAFTAWHLYVWYRNNRFCGCCGSHTQHDTAERMLRCPECGNMIFPKISPAVIVGVTDGDRLLMSKYAGRDYTHYALIAGYTEIGETLEETVAREVMEEVGLKVKNIRYYRSQPWGIDGNILMGFYCDLDGDDTIHLDQKELSLAEWHYRGAIPSKDDAVTLTREMIRVFDEGKEPK